MESSHQFLLTIGGIFLLGLLTSAIAERSFLPRVTLLLIFGALIGREALDIIPPLFSGYFGVVADMTLLMVGFLLGGKLTRKALRESAGDVFWIAICAALVTALAVSLGLRSLGAPTEVAIILGCIASATAPAAIMDVVNESRIKNRFSDLLLSIVALDDVVALLLFGIGLALLGTLSGDAGEGHFFMAVFRDIGVAAILGFVIGVPAAYLTGRIKQGQPMLSEALGIVFVCGGLAIWLDASYLIASMVMGAVVTNMAKHHEYPFHAIEGVESLFMVTFFVLAGASLELSALKDLGLMGAVYILCRTAGKYFGARIGSQFSGSSRSTKRWMGIALLPQAGVPIGMALVASNQLPEYRQLLLSIVISSSVLFEIIGPAFTRMAIHRAAGKDEE